MKTYKNAVLDDDGTFLPPSLEVRFNGSIRSNDGMLAHSLMRRNNLSFEEARIRIAESVEKIKSNLKTEREVIFGPLGILSLGEEDNISFTPFAKPKVFKGIYPTVGNPVASSLINETIVPDGSDKKFDTIRNYYIAVNKRFAKVAASFLIIIAIASTFVIPSLKNIDYTRYQKASVMPLDWQNEESSISIASTPSVDDNAGPEEISVNASEDPSCFLIVATFKTKDECEKFIASQPAELNSHLNIKEGKKVSRVYYEASNDRQQLLDIMNDETFKSNYSQAWIWSE